MNTRNEMFPFNLWPFNKAVKKLSQTDKIRPIQQNATSSNTFHDDLIYSPWTCQSKRLDYTSCAEILFQSIYPLLINRTSARLINIFHEQSLS